MVFVFGWLFQHCSWLVALVWFPAFLRPRLSSHSGPDGSLLHSSATITLKSHDILVEQKAHPHSIAGHCCSTLFCEHCRGGGGEVNPGVLGHFKHHHYHRIRGTEMTRNLQWSHKSEFECHLSLSRRKILSTWFFELHLLIYKMQLKHNCVWLS